MKRLATWISAVVAISAGSAAVQPAYAIQMDWGGQFWFENNWLNNYQLDRTRPGYAYDSDLIGAGGPYVPGAGEKNVTWYTAFLKLRPKLIVNDNVNIKGEFHVGTPIYGFLGRGYPTDFGDRMDFGGSQKAGMPFTAQRYWLNLITDFGNLDIGRAPIEWGLGAIWNAGDKLFDHYQSTGDMVRLTSKFGNFVLQPSFVKVSVGDSVAGALDNSAPVTSARPIAQGNDDVTDYNLAFKYDNSEEDFEFGMMWTRRTGTTSQKAILFNGTDPRTSGSGRLNFNLFDFYAKKKLGRFSLGAEMPYYSGAIGAVDGTNEFDYKAIAFVFEGAYTSDLWNIVLKGGHIPGQPSISQSDNLFKAVYLNRNYGLGLLMFHYNIYGLAFNNPDTLRSSEALQSPFDSPIVNANYAAVTPEIKLDKWSFRTALVAAWADTTAQAGKRFFNYQRRQFYTANFDQADSFMGWEFDLGTAFHWDENTVISWDLGFWFPGSYYAYTNVGDPASFNTAMMFGSRVLIGVQF